MLIPTNMKFHLVLGSTDMRKQINSLTIVVAQHIKEDVFAGHAYVFCNRRRNCIKVLYWDRNGFCLWQKRLEKERFRWPESVEQVMEMDARTLRWMLDGLDPIATRGHRTLEFSRIV
jgi:transposase